MCGFFLVNPHFCKMINIIHQKTISRHIIDEYSYGRNKQFFSIISKLPNSTYAILPGQRRLASCRVSHFFKICTLTFRTIKDNQPAYLDNAQNIYAPQIRIDFFSISGPALWDVCEQCHCSISSQRTDQDDVVLRHSKPRHIVNLIHISFI